MAAGQGRAAVVAADQAPPVPPHFVADGGVVHCRTGFLRHHHQVHTAVADVALTLAVAAEKFAHLPFYAVAAGGVGVHLARHGDAEAVTITFVGPCVKAQAVAATLPRAFKNKAETVFREQAAVFAESLPGAAGGRHRYTLSRARPRARRALITARPPRVRMRARNPWVRLRLT